MTGRDSTSVLRSLQRFFGLVLPAPWDVQPVRMEPQRRPLAVVRFLGASPSSGTAYVRRYVQPVEVLVYPVGVEGDAYAGSMEAERIKHQVVRALDAGHAGAGSRAMRVPLYDYAAVPLDSPLPTDAQPIDFLIVSDLNAAALPDPDADDLFTITVDFRVMYSDVGDTTHLQGATLEGVAVVPKT